MINRAENTELPVALAPILLFTYKRLDSLKKTIDALRHNYLASESELYVFSDGPKTETEIDTINKVRSYLKTTVGFKNINIIEASQNKGLANSIIDGVSQLIDKYGKVIVLEDDLITSSNFLIFMNEGLSFYGENLQVFSLTGFSIPIKGLNDNDVYFTQRASSWGWGTWKDRWNMVDWEVKDYAAFSKDAHVRKKFNKMGSDMASMLDKQMKGKINSWAIRWCYHQFRNDLYTVFPAVSKVKNIGFNNEATHTKDILNRFATVLDETGNTSFRFSDNIKLDKNVVKQFVKPYSILQRIKYKLLNTLLKG